MGRAPFFDFDDFLSKLGFGLGSESPSVECHKKMDLIQRNLKLDRPSILLALQSRLWPHQNLVEFHFCFDPSNDQLLWPMTTLVDCIDEIDHVWSTRKRPENGKFYSLEKSKSWKVAHFERRKKICINSKVKISEAEQPSLALTLLWTMAIVSIQTRHPPYSSWTAWCNNTVNNWWTYMKSIISQMIKTTSLSFKMTLRFNIFLSTYSDKQNWSQRAS